MKPRTENQNRALHAFFRLLSDSLNEAGLDQRKVLKPGISIPWNPTAIKELLWRPLQQAIIHKKSTTELSKLDEIDRVHEVLMRELGLAFHIPFIKFPNNSEKDQDYNYRKPKV